MRGVRSGAVLLGCVLSLGCGDDQTNVADTQTGEWRTETLDLPGLGLQEITYRMVDGEAILEGDIVLDLGALRVSPGGSLSRGAGRRNESARWIGGVVPFTVDPNVDLGVSDPRITGAIAHWQANTPITFIPRTNQPDYVTFFKHATACQSPYGRKGGKQIISMADACNTGAVIHEIGHSVGLYHEQSRFDRDYFVDIIEDNIQTTPVDQRHNFYQYTQFNPSDGIDNGPYDFTSLMHYPSTAFSKNGMPTIVRLDGLPLNPNLNGLSGGDIRTVKRMYPRFSSFASDGMPQIPSNFGAAVSTRGPGRLDVHAIALDGSLMHQSFEPSTGWSGWTNRGGVFVSGVDAVSWGPDRIDVVGRGQNNNVWLFVFDHGPVGFFDLGMQCTFDPAISSWSAGNLDVFCTGTDKQLKHRAFRNFTTWGSWENQGGVLTAGVDAVSWGVNRIDIVSKNSNSKMVHKTFDGGWSLWTDRGGALSGTPTISSWASGRFDIFGAGTDSNISKRSFELAWELDWGIVGGPGTEPDAVSWGVGRIDMVVRNASTGTIRHASVDNNN